MGSSLFENGKPGVGFGDVFPDQSDYLFDVFEEGDVVNAWGDHLGLDSLSDVLIVFDDLFGQCLKLPSDLFDLFLDLFVLGRIDPLPFSKPGLVKLSHPLFFNLFLAVELGKRIFSKGRFKTAAHRGCLVVFESFQEIIYLGRCWFCA